MRRSFWSVALLATLLGCGSASTSGARAPVETTAAAVRPPPLRCAPVQGTGRFDVYVLGSGGANAAPRAASGFVVLFDGQPRVLVDMGTGTFARLRQSGLDVSRLDTVLLTHLHRDHVDDLDEFLELRSRAETPALVRVIGPAGQGRHVGARVFVERLVGREGGPATRVGMANALRVDATDVERTDQPKTVFQEGDMTVSAVSVEHGDVPTLAFRVQRGPRSVVFSGDVANGEDSLIPLARSADLLVHEAAVLDPPTTRDERNARSPSDDDLRRERILHRYAPPQAIGRVAARAPVGELLLTHLPGVVRANQAGVLDSIRASFGGDVQFAEDCMLVHVGP